MAQLSTTGDFKVSDHGSCMMWTYRNKCFQAREVVGFGCDEFIQKILSSFIVLKNGILAVKLHHSNVTYLDKLSFAWNGWCDMMMYSWWWSDNFVELLIKFWLLVYFDVYLFVFKCMKYIFRYLYCCLFLDRELKYHNSGTILEMLSNVCIYVQ